MSIQILSRRSTVLHDRPNPCVLVLVSCVSTQIRMILAYILPTALLHLQQV